MRTAGRHHQQQSSPGRPTWRVGLVSASLGAVLLAACSASPTAPDRSSTPAAATVTITENGQPLFPRGLSPANISPEDLAARGWSCRVPPVPDRQVCSPPNQGFPSPATPPEERAASYQLMVFNGAGTFSGTEILIREDLYRGQTCESTGTTYDYRALIGYYECVHTVGH